MLKKKKNSTFIVVLVGTDLVFLNQEIESKERDEGVLTTSKKTGLLLFKIIPRKDYQSFVLVVS